MIYTPGGLMGLGGFGLGSLNPAQNMLCAGACDGGGFTAPGKANKIAKCTTACVGAQNIGNCDGKCNPMYNQQSGRNKCTAACQSTFVTASAPPPPPPPVELPPSSADIMANGGVAPYKLPAANGEGMGLIPMLVVGAAVVGVLYVGYRLLK